ncbi:MAG: GNAT family N-acetyltransferase [Eubacteriales bacterium]|nr:GNAT family N-acetyltransferase [Eubacteriales bacterium]
MEYSNKGLNFEEVNAFYDSVIDYLETAEFSPGWKKGIYPDEKMLRDAIENKTLHVMTDGDKIISAAILDNNYVEGYEKVPWDKSVELSNSLLLHAFCVKPEYMKKGIAKRMLNYLENHAKEQGFNAIRLDVLDGNLPAFKLYPACGYNFVNSMQLYYEDTGLTLFHMFEKLL